MGRGVHEARDWSHRTRYPALLRAARAGRILSPMADDALSKTLIDKIGALPPERIAEVEDFVDFIRARDSERALANAGLVASEPAFAKVWSNPEDDAYDAL